MMRKEKNTPDYTIDLQKIDGDGTFPCPKCSALIAPDNESEEFYQIVETRIKNDELAELIIQCNKCNSKIKLIGFLTHPK